MSENNFKKEEVIKMEEVNQQCLKLQKRHLISTIKTTMNLTSRMLLLPMVRKVLAGVERIMLSDMGFGVCKCNTIENMHRPCFQKH